MVAHHIIQHKFSISLNSSGGETVEVWELKGKGWKISAWYFLKLIHNTSTLVNLLRGWGVTFQIKGNKYGNDSFFYFSRWLLFNIKSNDWLSCLHHCNFSKYSNYLNIFQDSAIALYKLDLPLYPVFVTNVHDLNIFLL